MKKLAILAIAALVAGSAFAGASWIGDALIFVDDGSAGTWYSTTDYSPDWVTGGAFNDLGEITSLSLGAQLQVYDAAGASSWGGGGAGEWLNYRIDDGAWAKAEMVNTGNVAGNNMLMETGAKNEGSFAFDVVDVDVSSYAGDGLTHSLQVKFGPIDDAPETAVYSADFTVAGQAPSDVPEPATMSLLGLGALALVLRRKLRK